MAKRKVKKKNKKKRVVNKGKGAGPQSTTESDPTEIAEAFDAFTESPSALLEEDIALKKAKKRKVKRKKKK